MNWPSRKLMGEIGVSPEVHYRNPERGIVAMQSIDNQLAAGRDPEILDQISDSSKSLMKLIRKVHQPKNLNGHLTNRIAIDYVRRSYQDLPEGFLDKDDAALLERIVNTPWPEGELALTHNDFRSSNLLYDGERFLLIDWELGGIGHPFYDVAYFANYQALSKEQGDELFYQYLEREPTSDELCDYHRMRRIAFGFSATPALPGLRCTS